MDVPLCVLIVEDSENDALLVLRALRRAGYQITSRRVTSEAELREALKLSSWDLVLSDYSLPQFSGQEALKIVRQVQPDLPFILVSGAVGEDTAVAMMKAGAQDFILKDNLARLGPAVERELREAVVHRALRQAEDDLRNREAQFRSIIENVSDMIVLVDTQGTIRYHSPSVERILGHAPHEVGGRLLYDFIHPDDFVTAERALTHSADVARSMSLTELRVRHQDNSWRVLEGVVTNLLRDPAVQGLVCNFRDVTERKRLEEELFRKQRLESLGSLASGIAHDLNNLLTPILIAADVLVEEPVASEYHVLLEGLQVSAHRAADVVQHLLAFARGLGPHHRTVAPAHLLQALERLLKFSLTKRISLKVSLSPSLWQISGDETELLQVLVNLCVNARDAMPSGGRLVVDAANVTLGHHDLLHERNTEPGPYVHFRVTDTGEGIEPSILSRIFEPFFTTKQQGQGTGIGLSTSLNIVKNHHGLMRVYSEHGRGTRFSVYLPAHPTQDTATVGSAGRDLPRGNGEVVLVVDDEASIREVIRETLAAYGYCVLTAHCGAEALTIQAKELGRIDLAIVDTAMPLMDGPTTINKLLQKDPLLKVIPQGGFVSDSLPEATGENVIEFLEKPYTTEQLLHAVARALRQK